MTQHLDPLNTPTPHPFDVAMDNLAPMREELERRWAVRNQRRDPDYQPSTTTNGRWFNRLRAEAVVSRYIRRYLGIQDPDGRDKRITLAEIGNDADTE